MNGKKVFHQLLSLSPSFHLLQPICLRYILLAGAGENNTKQSAAKQMICESEGARERTSENKKEKTDWKRHFGR